MRWEIQHIDDCSNWEVAGERLKEALAATGHGDDPISFRLIRDPREATAMSFAGSPTIVADGIDLFPTSPDSGAIACRIYHTPSGLSGAPTVEQIAEGIRARFGADRVPQGGHSALAVLRRPGDLLMVRTAAGYQGPG